MWWVVVWLGKSGHGAVKEAAMPEMLQGGVGRLICRGNWPRAVRGRGMPAKFAGERSVAAGREAACWLG